MISWFFFLLKSILCSLKNIWSQKIYIWPGVKRPWGLKRHISTFWTQKALSQKQKKKKKHQFAEKTLILNFFLEWIRGSQKNRSVVASSSYLFFSSIFSFPNHIPELRSAFGLASLGKNEVDQLHFVRFLSPTF